MEILLQGFISGIKKLKNEDIIVNIITESHFLTLYRFYGLRHSIINIGRKIDFEVDYNGIFMPRLRAISQLGFTWENDCYKMRYFQRFLHCLDNHLKGTEEISSFYFKLLNLALKIIQKQSPNRALLDLYAMLLENEGRKSLEDSCFICDKTLGDKIRIARGFLSGHSHCINGDFEIEKERFFGFLRSNKSIFFSEYEVESLVEILLRGF